MKNRGFTLVEMMVAVSIFSVVMVISISSLLALVDSNRKAQSLKSVMNNLNFALDNMGRNIRIGYDYHCHTDPTPPPDLDTTKNCSSGGVLLGFEAHDGDLGDPTDQFVYRYKDGRIEKSSDGGASFIAITASEVNITNMEFYVTGTDVTDQLQPKVIMIIQGTAGVDARTQTSFDIQSTISQRLLDL